MERKGRVAQHAICLAIVMMVCAGVQVTAEATSVPAITKHYAHKMDCPVVELLPHGVGSLAKPPSPKNSGVRCKVNNAHGVQYFFVVRYHNPQRGLKWWRDWADGFIAKKHHVLVMPYGRGHSGRIYTKKWAKYSVRRLHGQLLAI